MTNIAQILKAEISRVARKEVRHEIESLKKTSAQQRSAIASLRREVVDLQRQLRQLGKVAGRSAKTVEPQEAMDQDVTRRFSPTRLAAHRTKLGLSAATYGKLVGVSGQSIYHWEQGTARPRAAQLQALVAVRGLTRKQAEERLAQG